MARTLTVPVDALADGRAVVDAGDRELVVLLVEGRPHVFDNACPHRGNPLADGEVLGEVLECAYHGWRFDLATGSCLVGGEAARRYPVQLAGGELRIELA